MKIAHIVNPITPRPDSDLAIAQPITLESMKRAIAACPDSVEVLPLAAQFSEDRKAVPDWMHRTPDLTASSLDATEFEDKRKLPRLSDIWQRLLNHCEDAEVLVYSNIDISLMPSFYQQVHDWINNGHDAISVTRRTIPKHYTSVDELEQMYKECGEEHPGDDCFIVRRSTAARFQIADVYLGAAYFDKQLLINCAARADKFLKHRKAHATFHIGDDRAWFNPKTRTIAHWNRDHLRRLLAELEAEVGPLYKCHSIWPHVHTVYEQVGFKGPRHSGWWSKLKCRLWSLFAK